jgi:antitoxin SocA-like protein
MNTFVFDIDKTVAAAGYIAKKFGGTVSTFVLLKMMYAAERHALKEWHRPITGDGFSAMKKGMVLSRTYNLIKHDVLGSNSDMQKWSEHFSARAGNDLTLTKDPDFDYLSEREKEALDKGFDQIQSLIKTHGSIADILHEMWPEWKDPGTSSIPIDPKEILSEFIEDEEELCNVALDIESAQKAKAALHCA